MRVIFVPVADRPECARALRTAFDLGNRLSANVCGCHIRPHSYSGVSLPKGLGSLTDSDAAWKSAWTGDKTKNSSALAGALFGKVAASYDYRRIKRPQSQPGAVWLERVGSPDKVISIMGPVSDMLIVSRPSSKGKLAQMFLQAALLNTSRPVLVLPASGKATIGTRVSIAWNQSTEAAQAVTAAMPLLTLADEVTIIASGTEDRAGPKSSHLATYLRYWGVKSKRVRASGKNDEQALLTAYRDADSDLLVMGAYSRSRLRQRIFGGVTEFMLQRANIPVLMLHT